MTRRVGKYLNVLSGASMHMINDDQLLAVDAVLYRQASQKMIHACAFLSSVAGGSLQHPADQANQMEISKQFT